MNGMAQDLRENGRHRCQRELKYVKWDGSLPSTFKSCFDINNSNNWWRWLLDCSRRSVGETLALLRHTSKFVKRLMFEDSEASPCQMLSNNNFSLKQFQPHTLMGIIWPDQLIFGEKLPRITRGRNFWIYLMSNLGKGLGWLAEKEDMLEWLQNVMTCFWVGRLQSDSKL